jgi:hypothetical protein
MRRERDSMTLDQCNPAAIRAGAADVLGQLDAHGYERRLVLEQDAAITGAEPPVGSGPVLDVQAGIEFLANTAPRRERVVT